MVTPSPPPLHGIRVVDASRVLAGPFSGQLLGDLGADVIKVERPGQGDDTRGWGPPFLGALSAYFLSCNRNKRSLTLDIANTDGNHLLHELLDKSDVLIENFRSDSLDKLGLAPDELLKRHPRLIACSISGFGRTGPMKDVPGYDFVIQAMSGLMAITGPPDGPPYKAGVALTDILTGLHAAIAVLACLRARDQSGHGYHIDLSLLDCAVAAQVNVAEAYLCSGKIPARQGNAHLQIVPYQLFATADGWLVLNVGNDSQWQSFCKSAGADQLANDDRYRTNAGRVRLRDELVPRIEALMKTRSTKEWESLLSSANVPHAVVWDYATLFQNEQILERGMKVTVRDPGGNPVELIGSPFHIQGADAAAMTAPPALGTHTNEVLKELLGLDEERIAQLRARGVL